MIETTYVRLEAAAAMLGTDADTLLIAAAEGRVRLYGLLNRVLRAEKQEWEETNEPPGSWSFTVDVCLRRFGFVPLETESCSELLCAGNTGAIRVLSDPEEDGYAWETDLKENDPPPVIEMHRIFAKRADIEAIKAAHATPPAGTIKDAPLPPDGGDIAEMNTMRAIAVMAWLLAENKPNYQINGRPNASQIGQALEPLAQKFFGEDVRGFAAFHKKISKALDLLGEDIKAGFQSK